MGKKLNLYPLLNGLGFFSNAIGYIKLNWLINIKLCIASNIHRLFFCVLRICAFKKYFLTEHKMALSSVTSLDEMKSLVLTKRKTHEEISNVIRERYPDMRGSSAMNVKRFCNES